MNKLLLPSPAASRPACASLRSQAGLSLVELMISIAIGLALMAGITILISQQSSASNELNKASRQIENGRYASQILRDDIELAGYYGEFFELAAPTALYAPCSTTTADLQNGIKLPIQGYDSPSTIPTDLATCINSANHVPGTDILVLRHAETGTTALASAVAGQPYLQAGLNASNAYATVIGTGSDTTAFTLTKKDGTAAPLRNYAVHIYYVSPCNVPASGSNCNGRTDDSGRPIPTLKRLELTVIGGAPAFTVTPLVEGIQDFQVDYGVDTDTDGAPDYYTTGTETNVSGTAMTAADWGNVMTVRLNLLARNDEVTGGHEDTKTYNLGEAGTVGPFRDGYKRRVFTTIVRAVNPSGRRAQ